MKLLKNNNIYFFVFIILFISELNAQNIVPNPGFEKYQYCPNDVVRINKSHKLIPGWTYPTKSTPDYFHRCGVSTVSVPVNYAGVSQPYKGDAYVGLILIGDQGGPNYREYIQARMFQRLKAGHKYKVSFAYRLSTYSRYAIDQLGIYFSDHDLRNDNHYNNIESVLGVYPQLKNEDWNLLDNKNHWENFCRIYTAQGNEQYIIIGNFNIFKETFYKEDTLTDISKLNKAYAYYYIDEVSVIPITESKDSCHCPPHFLMATANAIECSANIRVNGNKPPFTYQWSTGDTTQNVDFLPAGAYTFKVTDQMGCEAEGQVNVHSFGSPLAVDCKIVAANQTNTDATLTITGGVPPYRIKWSTGDTAYALQNLESGNYAYQVNDKRCGQIIDTIRIEAKDKFIEELETIQEGEKITLKDIFFDTNKSTLKPESYVQLDKLTDFLTQNSIQKMEISGHTDSDGKPEKNQRLSEGRAKAVVDYLVSKGIEKQRLEAVGYGETQPVAPNSTEEGKSLNRRVEFKILKK